MALNVSGKLGSSRRDDEPTPQIFICARHVADLAAAGDIPMKCEWLNSDVTGSRVCVCTSYDAIRSDHFKTTTSTREIKNQMTSATHPFYIAGAVCEFPLSNQVLTLNYLETRAYLFMLTCGLTTKHSILCP